MEDIKQKLPKSVNNRQCITHCYEKGTYTIHPVSLNWINSNEGPFCATDPYPYIDAKTGTETMLDIDYCTKATIKNNDNKVSDISYDIILPTYNFNHKIFLKIHYNIFSFEDAIQWVNENEFTSYRTIERILNCAWLSYGLEVDLLDERLINTHLKLIREYKFKDIISKIGKYISKKNDKIILSSEKNKSEVDDKELKEYLDRKLINSNNLGKFLFKYKDTNVKNWESINFHLNNIINEFIKYIEVKVLKSI
ncbi:MAG: hypothetical protein CMF62_02660 [Magnetococcales bacterium]|nr:hypothetical protein [Magnetococcales bacterium]|tara:strand:+ start:61026 stop:61781 length:756 start_codon:yes stop_codon:yes gene_type:complete